MKIGVKKIEQIAALHDSAVARVLNEQLFHPDLSFWLNDLRQWKTASPQMRIKAFKAYRIWLGIQDKEHDAGRRQEPPRTDAEFKEMFP